MPILKVEALPQKNKSLITQALKKTCVSISEVYGCPPEQVWAQWITIEPGHYVEGEMEAMTQPTSTHPPVATLTCFEGKSSDEIEEILKVAAHTLSRELGIPDNIFIHYLEAKSRQVIAGNSVVRR